MIGLTGAHRTGKTTLAKAWAEENEVEYVTPDVAGVIRTFNMDCGDIKTIEDRLKVQRKLVEACDSAFLRRKGLYITDRCPLDIAAYTMADAVQHMSKDQAQELNDIILDCFSITNACFGSIILVQPGIPFVPEPNKPPENVAYQEHIHTIAVGLAQDDRNSIPLWTIPRANTLMETRLEAVDSVHMAIVEDASYEAEGFALN